MQPLLVGLDLGTSSVKAITIDVAGRVVASASRSYPLSRPRPGWSEQDPKDWWEASAAALVELVNGGVDPARVAGIGLSGQMHGLVLLDGRARERQASDCAALRPAMLWNDQRTGAQCAAIERAAGGRRKLVEMVGNAALPGFTLPKILWLREHEPETLKRAAHAVLPKDFVRLKLTGELATDVGDGAGTLLFDVDARRYSARALELFSISPSLFPGAVESAVVCGGLTTLAASQTGLRAGTPVVAGSGDNQAGAIGAGVVKPGMVLATLGTSGVIYAHAERAWRDLPPGAPDELCGRLHTMCAADGDAKRAGSWSVTGCMLSAAGSLQWARDTLFPGESFETLIDEASRISPGCAGLVFLPYLTGERCPHPDPDARGGWIGLTSRHTRGHLVRAVLEGVTFAMGQILDLVRGAGVPVQRVRLGGGGAKSELWRQMQADVYGAPVALTNTEEGPALGAALLAGVGAGVWPSVERACAATITETLVVAPSGNAERYAPARKVFERLYSELRGSNSALAEVDRAS